MNMIDLIYDDAAKKFIFKRFPGAQFRDASDEVHEGRFEVELPDSDRDTFYKAALKEGWYEVSLRFQLMLSAGREEDIKTINRWVAEIEGDSANK